MRMSEQHVEGVDTHARLYQMQDAVRLSVLNKVYYS